MKTKTILTILTISGIVLSIVFLILSITATIKWNIGVIVAPAILCYLAGALFPIFIGQKIERNSRTKTIPRYNPSSTNTTTVIPNIKQTSIKSTEELHAEVARTITTILADDKDNTEYPIERDVLGFALSYAIESRMGKSVSKEGDAMAYCQEADAIMNSDNPVVTVLNAMEYEFSTGQTIADTTPAKAVMERQHAFPCTIQYYNNLLKYGASDVIFAKMKAYMKFGEHLNKEQI